MLIYLRCKEENLTKLFCDNTRPVIGDKIAIGDNEYKVNDVVFHVKEEPYPYDMDVFIERQNK